MSEQEQDAVVGRLVREKRSAVQRKAAIDAELKQLKDAIGQMFRALDGGAGPQTAIQALEGVKKYFTMDALFALLEEQRETQEKITDAARSLYQLGALD